MIKKEDSIKDQDLVLILKAALDNNSAVVGICCQLLDLKNNDKHIKRDKVFKELMKIQDNYHTILKKIGAKRISEYEKSIVD